MNKLELFDTDECSDYVRLSAATLRYYRHLGDRGPKSFAIGRKVFYRREDVDAWLEEQYKNSGKPAHSTA